MYSGWKFLLRNAPSVKDNEEYVINCWTIGHKFRKLGLYTIVSVSHKKQQENEAAFSDTYFLNSKLLGKDTQKGRWIGTDGHYKHHPSSYKVKMDRIHLKQLKLP